MDRMALKGNCGYRWLHCFCMFLQWNLWFCSICNWTKGLRHCSYLGGKKRIMKNVIWDRPKQESVGLSSSTSKTVMVASVWHFFLETCLWNLATLGMAWSVKCAEFWSTSVLCTLAVICSLIPDPMTGGSVHKPAVVCIMPATSGWKISTLSMRDLLTDAFPRCAEKCVRDHCCAPSVSPGPPPDWSNLQGTERHNALFL